MSKSKEEPKIVVTIDGMETETISIEEAINKGKLFSPALRENNLEDSYSIMRKVKKNGGVRFDLEELIGYLQEILAQFGNMPVVYFNAKDNCFTQPCFSDIDVVPKYFLVRANAKTTRMDIHNDKALSLYHV